MSQVKWPRSVLENGGISGGDVGTNPSLGWWGIEVTPVIAIPSPNLDSTLTSAVQTALWKENIIVCYVKFLLYNTFVSKNKQRKTWTYWKTINKLYRIRDYGQWTMLHAHEHWNSN